jgi:hypothetical protein
LLDEPGVVGRERDGDAQGVGGTDVVALVERLLGCLRVDLHLTVASSLDTVLVTTLQLVGGPVVALSVLLGELHAQLLDLGVARDDLFHVQRRPAQLARQRAAANVRIARAQ